MNMDKALMQDLITKAWNTRDQWTREDCDPEVERAVHATMTALDQGELRTAEKIDGKWVVNEWVKEAVLLSFKLTESNVIHSGVHTWYDKVPLKLGDATAAQIATWGVRFVPGSVVRRGAFIDKGAVLMPSFVNVGAHIGSGTMIDTWASVGSCAQVGANCHISAGAGIGGVLEPVQAAPTIIEDNCFIGARSEIVEGVIVEENSVLSMGVFIGQSTKIYDRTTGEIYRGRVPAGSVVVPGSLPSKQGNCSLYAAIIVKRVDAKTRAKTSVNELLRD